MHCSIQAAYLDVQHCFTFLPLPPFIFPGVVYPAVSPPIVPATRGLVFFHTICMQIALPPRINIYSVPRSVVINRKAAGEILLSLSLGVPSRSATLRSAGPVRETSRSHASCVSASRRVLMNMCVCTYAVCVCLCLHACVCVGGEVLAGVAAVAAAAHKIKSQQYYECIRGQCFLRRFLT